MWRTILFLIVAMTSLSVAASAQDKGRETVFAPEHRFAVPNDDYGTMSMNVEITQAQTIPPFIQQQVTMIQDQCLKDGAEIKILQYVSDHHRVKKLPPSYLLDMTELKPSQTKNCQYGSMCFDSGNCSLIGFAPVDQSTWDRTAWVTARKWSPFVFDAPHKKGKITHFALWASMDDCENREGRLDEGLCNLQYVWTTRGTNRIPLSPVAE